MGEREGYNPQERISGLVQQMMADPELAVKKMEEFVCLPGKIDNLRRFQGAVLNQALARVYLSAFGKVDAEKTRKQIVTDLLVLSKRVTNAEDTRDIKGRLYGARAQAGLVKHLRDSGWTVVLPDSMDEVWNFEVQSGSDFAAVDERGGIYFIDVRSRYFADVQDLERKIRLRVVLIERKFNSAGRTDCLLKVVTQALAKAGVVIDQKRMRYGFFCITLPGLEDYINQTTGFLENQIGQKVVERLKKEKLNRWI